MGEDIEIKEIPDIPREIIDAINNEKLVVFIGAGVSRLVGCQSWWDLAKNLINKCSNIKDKKGNSVINYRERELLLQTNDSKKLITIAKTILEDDIFYQEMKKALEPQEELLEKEDNVYDLIKSLKGICITTNADKILHRYYIEDKIKYDDLDFDIDNIANKNLYQIHGRIDRKNSLVFTVDQYLERYSTTRKENEKFISFLTEIFSNYVVLFIGYGVSEFELLDYIIVKTNTANRPRHFLLNPYYKEEKKILECDNCYYNKLNINVIPYSKDNLGYNQLTEVLKSWREKITLEIVNTVESLTDIENILENPNFDKFEKLKNDFLNLDYKEKFFLMLLKKEKISLKLINFILTNFSIKNINLEIIFQKDEWLELEIVKKLIVENEERDLINQEIKDVVLKNVMIIESCILKNENKNFNLNKIVLTLILILKETLSKNDKNLFSREMKIKQGWSTIFRDLKKYIFPFLIKNQKKEKLEIIFIKLIEYNTNHYMSNFYYEHSFDVIYSSLFEEYAENIFRICSSIKVTQYLYNLIHKAAIKDKYLFHRHFVTYINDKELGSIIGPKLLVGLLYKNLLVMDLNKKEYKKILSDMLVSKIEILVRIAVKIIGKNIEIKDLLFDEKLLIYLFENINEELADLLEKNCQKFTNEEIELLISGIESSFNDYDKNLQFLYRKSWLNKLKILNNSKIKELYDKYNSINSNENLVFQNEDIDVAFEEIKSKSPVTEKEIIQFINKDITSLKNKLLEYENQKESFFDKKPSKKGLMESLKEVSYKNTKLIVNNLKRLVDIDEEYLYYIFEGICKNNKVSLYEINILIEFLEDKIKDAEIWNSLENDYRLKLKRKISDVLYFIFQREDLFEENLVKIYNILKICLRKLPKEKTEKEDIVNFGLNSYKGNYLELLIKLNLKLKEIKSKNYNEVLSFTKKYLIYNSKDDVISYIIGYRIRSLIYLDKDWIEENKKIFFSRGNPSCFWNTMGAYLIINSQLNENLYNFMKDEYKIAVELFKDGISKYQNRLIEHLVLGYFYYKDKKIFNLINIREEFILEKIIRFSIYYSGKFNQIKVVSIWKKILKAAFEQEYEGKIYIQSIGLISKFNNINSTPLKEIINIISNNAKIDITDVICLEWINEYIKVNKKDNKNLKEVVNIIRKFTKKGKLFKGFANIMIIEKLIVALYENGMKDEADDICDDYIRKNNLEFSRLYLECNKKN